MNDFMYYKIKLEPNEEQKEIFDKFFGVTRFVYNKCIDICKYKGAEAGYDYNPYGSFIEIRNEFNKYRKDNCTNEDWINEAPVSLMEYAVKDLVNANKLYTDGYNNKPVYRKKHSCKQQFAMRGSRLIIGDDFIKISKARKGSKIGKIKCINPYKQIIGSGNKEIQSMNYIPFMSPRIVFNGEDYFLCVSVKRNKENNIYPSSCDKYLYNDEWSKAPYTDIIGIDLGAKINNWAVDSTDDSPLSRPDCYKETKRLKRLNKKMSRQRRINNNKYIKYAERNNLLEENLPKRKKSNNEIKTQLLFNKTHRRRTNKKLNVIHNYCSKIIKIKPAAIVMENLKPRSAMINKDHSMCKKQKKRYIDNINDSMFYTFRTIMQHKAENNNITFILADSNYPSTQRCSCCGNLLKIGTQREYNCPICGAVMDRDRNAAYNLKAYGISKIFNIDIPLLKYGEYVL